MTFGRLSFYTISVKQESKILIGVFLFLLIITFAEITYYFFVLVPKKGSTNSAIETTRNNLSSQTVRQTDLGKLIDDNMLFYLRSLRKNIISSTITDEMKGVVGEVDAYTKETKPEQTKLQIVLGEGENKIFLYFYTNEINKIVIVDTKAKTEKPLDLNNVDIKKGDLLTIKETIDLKKPHYDARTSVIITKL